MRQVQPSESKGGDANRSGTAKAMCARAKMIRGRLGSREAGQWQDSLDSLMA